MRQALVVSVWGAVFVVLIFSQSGPVGAQPTDDPLAGQTAEITTDTIGPIAVAGCTIAANATVVVTNEDGTQITLTNGPNENVDITATANEITITGTEANGNIEGAPTGGDPQTFDPGTGTVESSTGITCGNATGGGGAGNGGGAGSGGGNGADDQRYGAPTAAEDQYNVIIDTIPKKPLPNTGGFPLLLGAGLLLVCSAAVSVRGLRP